jgi:ATP/maltotriose-dependent transcriptional regulator MalT
MQLLAYVALRDLEAVRRCEDLLRPFPDDLHWSSVRLSLAMAAALRGDRETALADLDAVEAWARREGARPDLALALLARAELDPQASGPRLAEACDLLESLGMQRQLERARALRPTSPRAGGGLSPRELEVLGLVAGGMTNREIASTLVISERTVVNHLSHIFDKLGVENRAAATAYAHRNGLTE